MAPGRDSSWQDDQWLAPGRRRMVALGGRQGMVAPERQPTQASTRDAHFQNLKPHP